MSLTESIPPVVHAPEQRDVIARLESVGKSFGRGSEQVEALRSITLDVRDGELLCVVGASGCGKSTLLNLIADLVSPTTGRIERDPAVIGRGGTGMVFQTPVLLPWRTVLSNVLVPAEVLKLPAQEARHNAMEQLRRVGLSGFERSYPFQLSGGMQQRASIARALLSNPRLLLMDEPFGALDALTREEMNLDLEQVWSETGKTIVLVTHSIDEAVFLADRIVLMAPRPGRIAEVIESRLPRPRTLESIGSPAFVTLADRLRRMIRDLGGTARTSR